MREKRHGRHQTGASMIKSELIAKLAEGNINTRDDLADLAVDELVELVGMDEAEARIMIMKAREHWFTT